jgi:hypothetical protein
MRWVTARQLEDWAKTLGAREDLPKIVSDLIRASAPDVVSIRFPSGDKGQVRGFDGHLVSDVQALNVPQGRSYWEFGTNSDYKSKARADFEKRTLEVPVDVQQDTTFVFVSPWTWDSSAPGNKLEDFTHACKKSSSWKDVLYIDGVALEAWLEHRPAVSAWHSRNTLQLYPVDGIRSADEFWAHFVGQFEPPITDEVLLCERDPAAKRLIQDLLQPSNAVSLVADSPDEVLAFAIAAIHKALADVRLFLEARTLVVDSTAAGRHLPLGGGLVLFLRGDAAKSPQQFLSIGTTLVPLGRHQPGSATPVLGRPTGYAMGMAMRSMGLEENEALTLARGCGRSLTALARLIPGGASDPPAWLQRGSELLPAILVGAWDTSNSRDCEIVEHIAGRLLTCRELERRLRPYLGHADPPFDLEGTIWKVRAPMDAFVRVGHLIAPQDAELLREAMRIVFANIEPDPQPDEIVGLSRSKPNGYSEWLRDGLATTLLLLAVWSEIAHVNLGGESGQEFANRTLKELPGLRTDPRLLTSLRDELPLLAEAAPDPLLSALEHMLEGAGDAILPIFKEHPALLHPTSKHTGVLWALETLAWDPDYFHRAVMVLARLAAIDPGGHIGNRPANSLAEIFVLWNPNTNASSTQRLTALEEILRTYPDVGWNLIFALLPSDGGVSGTTAKPRLREGGAADRPAITYRELWANQAVVSEHATALAGHDFNRWMQLVPRIASFPSVERDRALAALDDTLSLLGGTEHKSLWTKVRDEVARHERFSTATWALPEQQLSALRSISEKHAPSDPIIPVATLFNTWALLDDSADSSKGKRRRAAALQQLFAEAGSEAVVQLDDEVRMSHLIVEAAEDAGFSAPQVIELLSESYRYGRNSNLTVGLSGLYRRVAGADRAEAWLTTVKVKGGAAEVIADLLQTWPDGRETWSIVRHFGPEVVAAFWKRRSPRYLKGPRPELLRSVLMLLRYGRALEAIQSSLNRLGEIPSRLILRMLDAVIPQLNEVSTVPDAMTNYYVKKVLQELDRRSDVTESEIADREYKVLPLLEYDERPLRVHNLMAKDADFFHAIIRNVYLGKGEERREVDTQTEANARLSYSLLSHFSLVPGEGADGIDGAVLAAWVDKVRRLGAETDRVDITDSYVGRVLAHAPPDADGAWPHRAIRAEIERLASDEIEHGIQIERFNMRGVHSRDVYGGGDQERNMAKTNYDAAALAAPWPRTAALLRAIGKMWDETAKLADIDAAQWRLRS